MSEYTPGNFILSIRDTATHLQFWDISDDNYDKDDYNLCSSILSLPTDTEPNKETIETTVHNTFCQKFQDLSNQAGSERVIEDIYSHLRFNIEHDQYLCITVMNHDMCH